MTGRVTDRQFFHISFRFRDIKYSNKTSVTSVVVHSKFPYWIIVYIFNITGWNHLKLCKWIYANKCNNTMQVLVLSWQTIIIQISKIQLGLFSLRWQLFPGLYCLDRLNMLVQVYTRSMKLKIVDTEEKINNCDLETM